MKKLILISALLFSFNGNTVDLENTGFSGSMRCEIKSMRIEVIEDGKTTVYSGYEDDLEVGDKILIVYEAENLIDLYQERVIQRTFTLAMVNEETQEYMYNSDYNFTLTSLEKNSGKTVVFTNRLYSASFSPEFIRREGSTDEFRMSRYYKGDWNGIFIRHEIERPGVFYFTFDCRQRIDQLDQTYTLIKQWHDEKYPPE